MEHVESLVHVNGGNASSRSDGDEASEDIR